ncbi:uncharacterized protein F5147DRAFT_820369 [Suillus discolor]|uniref:Uncharacterized protein n=1 Tax=Suillus discolor TaxID=1912936 RepID=A0A9P7FGK4_9AGAM|nr:uncharacterized protein F5147DRAFT_820369 [Suillus discolor]KAG2115247.1 hypothetical protein F5147DRAFT_820369 [Suillus discolor]
MNQCATKPHQAHEFCRKTEISPLKPVGPKKLNPCEKNQATYRGIRGDVRKWTNDGESIEQHSRHKGKLSTPDCPPSAIEDRPKRILTRIIISAALMLCKKRLQSASKITESIPGKAGPSGLNNRLLSEDVIGPTTNETLHGDHSKSIRVLELEDLQHSVTIEAHTVHDTYLNPVDFLQRNAQLEMKNIAAEKDRAVDSGLGDCIWPYSRELAIWLTLVVAHEQVPLAHVLGSNDGPPTGSAVALRGAESSVHHTISSRSQAQASTRIKHLGTPQINSITIDIRKQNVPTQDHGNPAPRSAEHSDAPLHSRELWASYGCLWIEILILVGVSSEARLEMNAAQGEWARYQFHLLVTFVLLMAFVRRMF